MFSSFPTDETNDGRASHTPRGLWGVDRPQTDESGLPLFSYP